MTELDFQKKYFSVRKCWKYAGKTVPLLFSRDFIISFFRFFAQRCVLTMLKIWPSPIFKKKIWGNSDFFHIFLCFFTQRHDWFIIVPVIKAESIVNNNLFLHPKLSKNPYSTPYPHQQLMIRFNTLCIFVMLTLYFLIGCCYFSAFLSNFHQVGPFRMWLVHLYF